MIYQKSSKHSPQEVEQSLREAAQRHKFGVLHVLDLKNTLHDKGIDLDNEVRIYDVCNPLAASQGLAPGPGRCDGAAVPENTFPERAAAPQLCHSPLGGGVRDVLFGSSGGLM